MNRIKDLIRSTREKFLGLDRKKKILIVSAITGSTIAIVAASAFAYNQYIYYQPENVLKRMVNNMSQIKTYSNQSTYQISGTAPNFFAMIEPELAEDGSEMIFDLAMKIDGTFDLSDIEKQKMQFDLGFSINIDDQIISSEGEIILVDQSAYFRLNNVPYFIYFLESLENKWISLPAEVEKTLSEAEAEQEDYILTSEQQDKLAKWIIDEEVITITDVSRETIDGIEMFVASYIIDTKKLPDLYDIYVGYVEENKDKQYETEKERNTHDVFSESERESTRQSLEMVANHSKDLSGTAHIGKKDSYLYFLSMDLQIDEIPDTEVRDITMSIKTQIRDINKPVNVTKPEETMTFEEAAEEVIMIVSGITDIDEEL
ncbi:MAG: hypothetical protein ACOCXQ_01860 [Patescibacteria group bacterium]